MSRFLDPSEAKYELPKGFLNAWLHCVQTDDQEQISFFKPVTASGVGGQNQSKQLRKSEQGKEGDKEH